jgi:hypothetical protein
VRGNLRRGTFSVHRTFHRTSTGQSRLTCCRFAFTVVCTSLLSHGVMWQMHLQGARFLGLHRLDKLFYRQAEGHEFAGGRGVHYAAPLKAIALSACMMISAASLSGITNSGSLRSALMIRASTPSSQP